MLGFAGPTGGAEGGLEVVLVDDAFGPGGGAEGTAAVDGGAEGFELGFVDGGIDGAEPVGRAVET